VIYILSEPSLLPRRQDCEIPRQIASSARRASFGRRGRSRARAPRAQLVVPITGGGRNGIKRRREAATTNAGPLFNRRAIYAIITITNARRGAALFMGMKSHENPRAFGVPSISLSTSRRERISSLFLDSPFLLFSSWLLCGSPHLPLFCLSSRRCILAANRSRKRELTWPLTTIK